MLKFIFTLPMRVLRWFVNWRPGQKHVKIKGQYGSSIGLDLTFEDLSEFIGYILAFIDLLKKANTDKEVLRVMSFFLARALNHFESGGKNPFKIKATKPEVISTIELCYQMMLAHVVQEGSTLTECAQAQAKKLDKYLEGIRAFRDASGHPQL